MGFAGQIKRSQVTATPTGLLYGELAYSESSSTLFIGDHAGSSIAIAGAGLFAKLASPALTGTPTAPTPSTGDNSSLIATTAFVKAQGYLTPLSISTGTFTKVTVSTNGLVTAGADLSASDIPTLDHTKISDFDTQVRSSRLDQMAVPTSNLSLNTQRITNLVDPSNPQDAATKAYVDAAVQGLSVKDTCVCATTANISLSGTQTIDGHSAAVGERVLVKNQTTQSQNGIYVVASGAWGRAADMDTSNEFDGAFIFVENGTTNAATGWVCNAGTVTVGTTAVTFVQFSGAGNYTASGNGITLSGTTFSLVGVAGQITISASGIGIDTGYVGQSSITTTGTLSSGGWDGGTF